MSTNRRGWQRGAGLRGEGGYSLVELMTALMVALVVGLGIYATFNYVQKSTVAQKNVNDLQTACNFAMDQMKAELMLAGYRARDQVRPISAAAAGSVTFEYWDDHARDEGPFAVGYNGNTQVTYNLQAGNLVRQMQRYKTGAGGGYDATNTVTQTLATNVQSLSFAYLSGDNAAWTGDVKEIRAIRPTLVCSASRPDPNTGKTPQVTLTGEVRARNVGVAATAVDTTPPAAPTGVIAWDPGSCGTLQLRWNANSEADLEGYTIFYGLASGSYSERVTILRAPRAAGQYEYYALTGLTSNRLGPPPVPAQYYVALQSFDKSGNLSLSLSTVATGNPTPSARTESSVASYGTDTAVDPILPPAPTGFTAVATPSTDGSISLSWTPPAVAGLAGYRLYRGTSASFVPNDTPVTGNRIADETQLGAGAVAHTDTGHGLPEGRLVGCQTYYYKICPVICDRALVASYTTAQYAAAAAAATDTTPPANPVIAARPGYRRIILTLANPVRSGPGSDPDFTHTLVHWSKTGFPAVDAAPGAVSPSPKIPRSAGTFTGTGTLPTINFNDETSPTATAPNLAPDTTYYFLAVAYDTCGNHTTVNSSSIAEGTQCGDCLLPAPAPPGTPDPACYQAPSGQQPTAVDAEGCYGFVDLSWNPVDDVVIRDFQGFRISRREGPSWVGGTNEVSLTGDDAAWLTSFTDATLEEGKRYTYRIMATDCYYEQHHGKPSSEWPEAGNDPNDNFREVFLSDVAVGRPLLDASLPAVLTGSLTSGPLDFQHNPVTFFVLNNSGTRLTLEGLDYRWDNADAWLQRISLGDGSTTPVTDAFEETATPLTHGAAGSTVPLAPATGLDALDGQIPFQSVFANADRSLSSTSDMRATWLDYSFTYTNNATGTAGCQVTDQVYAPLGPYVYSVSQSKPYAGTVAWPVPGDAGTNGLNAVVVPGGADVAVYAEVLDASGVGIAPGSVRLYYFVDSSKSLAAAPPVTGTFPSLNYNVLTMAKVGGDQWTATIPAAGDAHVWYFVVAVDAQTNFDRDPEPWAGAYQYRQLPPDDCSTIPNPPAISGSTSGGNVTLTWTTPTMNATPAGSAYTDGRGFKVYRNRNDGTGWQLHYAGVINNPNATTFTDSAVYNLDTLTYDYYVTSFDACAPTPNESAASNVFTEQVEGVCGNTPSPPVITSGSESAALPNSVTITWTAPTTNEPPATAPLTDLGGFQVWRKTFTGAWTLLASVGPSTLSYTDDTASNIKNEVYSYYVKAYDICTAPGPKVSAPSNLYEESLVNNPCDEIPNPPTLSGSATSVSVTLTWVPPATNTNGEDFRDGAGYEVWRSMDGGAYSQIATVGSATTAYTDTTIAADIGTSVFRYYVVVFDVCGTPNRSAPSSTYAEGYNGPCGTTPNPPALSGVSAASGVTLTWTAPATNTDGSSYSDPGGFRVYRRKTATGSWSSIASTAAGTLTYLDASITGDVGTEAYFYYVTAVDSCAPTPNESAASSVYAENFSDPCAALTTPAAPPTLTAAASSCTANGGKVTLTWTAPTTVPDGYRVYGCTCAGTTPACACTPATKLNATDPLTALTFQHTPGGKLNAVRWRYAVKSVNKGTCSNSALWKESPFSPIDWDRCTPQ